jgi:hypothetical protein
LEAHHKINRTLSEFASSFDGGHPNSTFFLPADRRELTIKQSSEPTSLLEYLQFVYGSLFLRVTRPAEVNPPIFSISFPKFLNPKFYRESRKKEEKGIF